MLVPFIKFMSMTLLILFRKFSCLATSFHPRILRSLGLATYNACLHSSFGNINRCFCKVNHKTIQARTLTKKHCNSCTIPNNGTIYAFFDNACTLRAIMTDPKRDPYTLGIVGKNCVVKEFISLTT